MQFIFLEKLAFRQIYRIIVFMLLINLQFPDISQRSSVITNETLYDCVTITVALTGIKYRNTEVFNYVPWALLMGQGQGANH